MTKISKLAIKFAMKLGLEPRSSMPPSSKPRDELGLTSDEWDIIQSPQSYDEDQFDEPSQEELKYLGKIPNEDIKDSLNFIRANMHGIAQNIDLGKFDEALELIGYTQHNLDNLVLDINTKIKQSKKASINHFATDTLQYGDRFFNNKSEEDSEDNDETVFQEIVEDKPVHLPAILKEYLKDLYYMDRNELRAEQKKLRQVARQFTQRGDKLPYLLQKRVEAVDDLLMANAGRY